MKSKSNTKKRTAPRRCAGAAGSAFIAALDKSIEFHRTNTNDPHNVGTAVMVALTEVRDAMRYELNI